MAILTKENLALLEATAKTDNSVFALTSVLINPDESKVWVSNGHSLYSSIMTEKDEGYPELGINGIVSKECLLVPAAALQKAQKNIPSRVRVPILSSVQVLIDDEYKHLVTSDLETTQDLKIKHNENNEWPRYQSIIDSFPKELPENQTVGISVDELEVLVKVLKKAGKTTVKLTVNGAIGPMKIESPGIEGYIMPYAIGY